MTLGKHRNPSGSWFSYLSNGDILLLAFPSAQDWWVIPQVSPLLCYLMPPPNPYPGEFLWDYVFMDTLASFKRCPPYISLFGWFSSSASRRETPLFPSFLHKTTYFMLMLSQKSLTLGKQKDFTSQLCKQQKIKYGTFISANHLGHFFQGASAFYYKSCLTSCPQLSAA